jgi:hypothetical protein
VHGSFAALRMTSKDIKPSAWVLRCTQDDIKGDGTRCMGPRCAQDDINIQLSRARGTHTTQRITDSKSWFATLGLRIVADP